MITYPRVLINNNKSLQQTMIMIDITFNMFCLSMHFDFCYSRFYITFRKHFPKYSSKFWSCRSAPREVVSELANFTRQLRNFGTSLGSICEKVFENGCIFGRVVLNSVHSFFLKIEFWHSLYCIWLVLLKGW